MEKDYISNPNFNFEYIKGKSAAAAGLCGWVINIVKYFRIYQVGEPGRAGARVARIRCLAAAHATRGSGAAMLNPNPNPNPCVGVPQVVAPKRAMLAEANKKLDGANKKLSGIRAKVKELQDKVEALEQGLMKATEDKNAAMAQVGVGVLQGWCVWGYEWVRAGRDTTSAATRPSRATCRRTICLQHRMHVHLATGV